MTQAEKINMLQDATNLTNLECKNILIATNWDTDEALNTINIFISSLLGAGLASKEIIQSITNAGLYHKLSSDLSNYNTMRGGTKGFKGFVFEELHATDATIKGQFTEVISKNRIADFKILNPDGTTTYAQAKVGYGTAKVDWSLYDGQTIIIDNGNQELISSAKSAGKTVIESSISEQEAKSLANAMQRESKITGNPTAKIVPKVHSAGQVAKQCHTAGLSSAKKGGTFGAGFSIGSNIVELIDGEKEVAEAAKDIAKDTAIATATGYAVGATATAIGSTAVGSAAIGAATTAGTALAGTVVGTTAIAAGTTVAGAATAAGAAVTGAAAATGTAVAGSVVGTAATAAGTAIAGSAVGAAVTGAAAAAGTAVAGTAVGGAAIAAGTAAAAATVAAAPVVIAGAAIGGVFAIGKKIFGR